VASVDKQAPSIKSGKPDGDFAQQGVFFDVLLGGR
jgi:hypothetical protein